MFRVVAISDTHCQHAKLKLPSGDCLIHAGDACGSGSEREFRDFAEWFNIQPFEHKIFVAGNHDRYVEQHGMDAMEILGPHVHYLQDSMCIVNGYEIWGSPWQPPFCDWAFNFLEERLRLAFALIPDGLDILITHGPPREYGDLTDNSEHIGSFALGNRLAAMAANGSEPAYHVFGHCHNGYGVMRGVGHGVAINASQCDEQYRISNPPVVLNI